MSLELYHKLMQDEDFEAEEVVCEEGEECPVVEEEAVVEEDTNGSLIAAILHLTVNFPGYSYTDLMYVLPLGVSATVILGAPFLEEISPFICDMRREARTISFRKHGRTIRLEPSPEPRPGVPVISLRRAMLDMRVRRRLLSSA